MADGGDQYPLLRNADALNRYAGRRFGMLKLKFASEPKSDNGMSPASMILTLI